MNKRELPANVRSAIVSGFVPTLRDWRSITIDTEETLTRAEEVMSFAEDYLKVPEGDLVGQPLRLEPFQEAFIYAVYDNPAGTRRAILSMARKNSKTVTCAIILLNAICGSERRKNSMLCSGAMGREQAALIFQHCCKFIYQSVELQAAVRIVPSSKRLIGLKENVEYHALAKEGGRAMGRSDRLIIGDEWGQITAPTDDFVEALTSSQGAHSDALQIIISTQAPNDQAMLSTWIDDAIRADDPKIVCHLYAAPNDCDLMDEKAWYQANPALGIFRSKEDLAEQMKQAVRLPTMEAKARNLLLNNRISSDVLAFSPTVWKQCAGPIDLDVFRENPVYMGLDLSSKNDLTAAVLAAQDPVNGVVYTHALVFCPTSGIEDRGKRDRAPYKLWCDQGHMIPIGSNTMDFDQIAEAIGYFLIEEVIEITEVHYDKHMMVHFQAACERESVLQECEWVAVPQNFRDMGVRLASTLGLMLDKKLRHNSPLLNYGAVNAIAVQGREGLSALDKKKSTARIDMIVALLMATWKFGDGQDNEEAFDTAAMIG